MAQQKSKETFRCVTSSFGIKKYCLCFFSHVNNSLGGPFFFFFPFSFFHFHVLGSALKLKRNLNYYYLPVGQLTTPVWLPTVYAFSPTHTHHFQVLIKFLFLNFCGQLLHLLFHFLAISRCKQNTTNMTLTFSPSNSAAPSVHTKANFSGVG